MSAIFAEDCPAADPLFDFDLIAQSLVPLLRAPADGALVLGIHGPWGSGKTTLMRAVARALGAGLGSAGQGAGTDVFVDFNAWKYHDREALWRALILRLIAELRPLAAEGGSAGGADGAAKLDELTRSLYEAFVVQEKGPWSVNWRVVITEVITIGLSVIHLDFVGKALAGSASWVAKLFRKKDGNGLDETNIEQLGSLLQRATTERQVVQVQSIEQFLGKFRQVMDGLRADGRRVYVLIDDLDRCLPDAALDIFESIKLFLDAAGCVFIVALDRDVIRKGLRLRYGGASDGESALLIDPDQYIEKTISISCDLPRLSDTDVEGIIDGFELPVRLYPVHKKLIISGLGTNPRRIKRFMNTLGVQLRLAQLAAGRGRAIPGGLLTGEIESLSLFIKLLLISYRYSGFFALTAEDAKLLGRLEEVRNSTGTDREKRVGRLLHESAVVRGLAGDEQFWELMGALPQFRADEPGTKALMRWFRQGADVGFR